MPRRILRLRVCGRHLTTELMKHRCCANAVVWRGGKKMLPNARANSNSNYIQGTVGSKLAMPWVPQILAAGLLLPYYTPDPQQQRETQSVHTHQAIHGWASVKALGSCNSADLGTHRTKGVSGFGLMTGAVQCTARSCLGFPFGIQLLNIIWSSSSLVIMLMHSRI